MLSVQTRSTTWTIQYALGATPTTFATLGTYSDPGVFGITTKSGLLLGAEVNNQADPLWIRIVALSATSGSGTRDSMGIDNFVLSYSAAGGGSTLFWSGNGATFGGSGIWDASTTATWSNSNSSVTPIVWDSSKAAVFGGTASGTVTVNGSINASAGMNFSTDAYVLNLGPSGKIVLTGADATTNSIGADIAVSATINVPLDGTAGMTKTGAGTVVLTSNNTYTGGTTIFAGTLQIGSGGTSGSIVGDVTNNGTFKINRSNDIIFSNSISGNGSLVQAGPGKVTLTGSVASTVGTTIAGGTLQLGDGTNAGSLTGGVTINSGATLAFNQPGDLTIASTLTGAGSVSIVSPTLVIYNSSNRRNDDCPWRDSTNWDGSFYRKLIRQCFEFGNINFQSQRIVVYRHYFGQWITGETRHRNSNSYRNCLAYWWDHNLWRNIPNRQRRHGGYNNGRCNEQRVASIQSLR